MVRQRSTAERSVRQLLGELEAIYRAADEAYAGYRCDGSSECCRFGIIGREPYVTSVEAAAVELAMASRGGPLSPRHRALPLASPDERTCPLLNCQGRCSIYAQRPLGCRTFWCSRAEVLTAVPHRRLRQLVRQLQQLALRHEPNQGDKGRPLTSALGLAGKRRR